ncbi:S-adenosyl-L-methionine-dependent methyltransferases superfamily protein isoform X2 [Wolffia australiana]
MASANEQEKEEGLRGVPTPQADARSHSPVHQIQQYQRRGEVDCGLEKPNAFFDCLRLRTKKPLETQVSAPLQAPPPPASSGHLPFVSRTELPHNRLYDFAKTALIKIFVSPYASVCDLYCGGGSDADKWDEAQISHYIGVDASSSGISDARETWESHRKPYTAEFLDLDPSLENLETHLEDKGIPVDIVCCLQHLQLCFESAERARNLLRNVSNMLKPGGYFFGITPDSSTIWTKYQKNVEASHSKAGGTKPIVANCIRSENYVVTFETEEEKFPLFGKKYHLKFANDIASENHCLVHFPSLIRLAREAGLEYIEIQNLTEFYDDNRYALQFWRYFLRS